MLITHMARAPSGTARQDLQEEDAREVTRAIPDGSALDGQLLQALTEFAVYFHVGMGPDFTDEEIATPDGKVEQAETETWQALVCKAAELEAEHKVSTSVAMIT